MGITMRDLSTFDREVLAGIPNGGPERDHAVVVWIDQDGDVQVGPCRYRRVTSQGTFFDCSPFPGAWSPFVTEDQIIAVRHVHAMALRPPARD